LGLCFTLDCPPNPSSRNLSIPMPGDRCVQPGILMLPAYLTGSFITRAT
jgi:hypothetical protein